MRWTPLLAAPVPLVAAVIVSVPGHATVYFTTEQAQQAMFPGAAMTPVPLQLTAAQRATMLDRSGVHEPFLEDRVWRASTGGYFVIDEVLGKHERIKYAVAIGSDGAVRGIEILEYNESYGYEVRDPAWRQQFVGKTAASKLQLNADIKNISGATLSSKHLTGGVKRILVMHELALKGRP